MYWKCIGRYGRMNIHNSLRITGTRSVHTAVSHLLEMKDVTHTSCNHLGLLTGERYIDAGNIPSIMCGNKGAGALCICAERIDVGVLSHTPHMRDGKKVV